MSDRRDAAQLLRPGLLDGVHVLLAGAHVEVAAGDVEERAAHVSFMPSLAQTVGVACGELGARVTPWRATGPAPTDVDVLVIDGAASFAAAREHAATSDSAAARAALRECLDAAWAASHAVANAAFIDAGRPGRIVYVAPPSGAGAAEHADAARAALENLARTLSIEWARHGVTTVAIAPGVGTADGEVAALCAYLASPAGAYFSGAQLDLRA